MTNPSVTDEILADFLREQFATGLRLASESDLLTVTPLSGNPPSQYVVEFRCKGLAKDTRGAIVECNGPWGFGINFPGNYLRGGFHAAEVLAYLGPVKNPFHPNFKAPFVCLEVKPATSLPDLIFSLFELVTWSLVSTHDEGLNHEASQWYRNQKDSRSFPIDRRPLKRRTLNITVKPLQPIAPLPSKA
jgi:hypothetical protein